ncbi:MAG: ABC-2 transporter permease, partial [Lachnospiraceae bacterium]|nr:ABC-2 transporter permease [Lachnospiraceae bacterium]
MKKNNATIGLILYSIHSASGNVIMLSLVYVLVGIIAIISGDRILVSASVGIGVLCVSNAILISSPKDANSKWNKLRLALPVKRSN